MTIKKVKIGDIFLTTLKIWGSAWIAYLIAMVPLYIWRGIYHEPEFAARGEHIIMSLVGAIVGFVALLLIHGRSDAAERMTDKDMWQHALYSVGIYIIAWMPLWIIAENNYVVATCGYHLIHLFAFGPDGQPTVASALLAALIYGVFYMRAIVLGTKMARRRRTKG